MSKISGATLLARNLRQQGVEHMFGVVGFPVQPVAAAAQREGMTYVGMRNEQAASYAAQASGYLTGRPGACVTVCGPGVIHALAGLANAKWNAWPMIHIGGASPTYQNGMGAFQEERQVMAATPYCKYAQEVDRADRIPYFVEQAVRTSIYGRPGAVYLDFPDKHHPRGDRRERGTRGRDRARAAALPRRPGIRRGRPRRARIGRTSPRHHRQGDGLVAGGKTRCANSSSAPASPSSPPRWARG